jgi:hypothetical protein
MTKEEFKADILTRTGLYRKEYPFMRKGQTVFNMVHEHYNKVSTIVKDEYDIDCYYRDDKIDEFLDKCWEVWNKTQNN